MTTTNQRTLPPPNPTRQVTKPSRLNTKWRRYGPPLLLIAPSVILIGIFVYYLIGSSAWLSLQDTNTNPQFAGVEPSNTVWFQNYIDLLKDPAFLYAIRNLALYTVVFVAGTMFFGFLWAWILEKRAKAEGLFRTILLFPMAISPVAAGVVWRWLLNQNTGAKASGLNRLFEMTGLTFLENPWWSVLNWGIAAIAIPSIWQLSGYVMALFLAGFRGIPDELREAARVDGANEWQLYRHVLFPQLSPVVLSALIICGHMSLKVFDIIMTIAGKDTYAPRVPATVMYQAFYKGQYSTASAVGILLLLAVLALIIPYLVHVAKEDK